MIGFQYTNEEWARRPDPKYGGQSYADMLKRLPTASLHQTSIMPSVLCIRMR